MAAAESKKKNLGRGLSALLGEDDEFSAEPSGPREIRRLPVEMLKPGRFQPRQTVDDEPLQELAQSIADKGVLQPLLVRRHQKEEGIFEIIAGERRWRAAQLAQVHEVPVIVKELDDREALEIGLIENLQREDLSPLDEAEGFRRLKDEFSYTQATLAASLGKSRSHVANTMRLLNLPAPIKDMIERSTLSAGHARALLNADDPVKLARTVARRGLNVRQTEKLVQRQSRPAKPRASGKDSDTLALERDLSNLLGLKVGIRFKGGSGTLTIQYQSIEQLDDILHKLSQGAHGAPREDAPIWPENGDDPLFEASDPAKLEVDFAEIGDENDGLADEERTNFNEGINTETIAGIPIAPPDDPVEEPA
jgi:ParB family transcriptional regulator, chromosome partitioning protein